MSELREFIKNDVRSFVRKQRQKSGLNPETVIFGYSVETVENTAEKIPCCDLFRILKVIASEEEVGQWHTDFQFKVYQIKKKSPIQSLLF